MCFIHGYYFIFFPLHLCGFMLTKQLFLTWQFPDPFNASDFVRRTINIHLGIAFKSITDQWPHFIRIAKSASISSWSLHNQSQTLQIPYKILIKCLFGWDFLMKSLAFSSTNRGGFTVAQFFFLAFLPLHVMADGAEGPAPWESHLALLQDAWRHAPFPDTVLLH